MRPVEEFFIPMVKHPTEFPAEITVFLEYCRENLQLGFKDKIRSIFLTVRLPLLIVLLPRSSSQGLSGNVQSHLYSRKVALVKTNLGPGTIFMGPEPFCVI